MSTRNWVTDTANSLHRLVMIKTKSAKSSPPIGTNSEDCGHTESERIAVLGKVDVYYSLPNLICSLEPIFGR